MIPDQGRYGSRHQRLVLSAPAFPADATVLLLSVRVGEPGPAASVATQSVAQDGPNPRAHAEGCSCFTPLAAEALLARATPVLMVRDHQP